MKASHQLRSPLRTKTTQASALRNFPDKVRTMSPWTWSHHILGVRVRAHRSYPREECPSSAKRGDGSSLSSEEKHSPWRCLQGRGGRQGSPRKPAPCLQDAQRIFRSVCLLVRPTNQHSITSNGCLSTHSPPSMIDWSGAGPRSAFTTLDR